MELIKKTLMEAISSSLRTVKVQPKSTPVFEQQQISFPYPVRKEEKQVIEQPKIQPKIKEDPITKAFDTYQKPIENKVQEQKKSMWYRSKKKKRRRQSAMISFVIFES